MNLIHYVFIGLMVAKASTKVNETLFRAILAITPNGPLGLEQTGPNSFCLRYFSEESEIPNFDRKMRIPEEMDIKIAKLSLCHLYNPDRTMAISEMEFLIPGTNFCGPGGGTRLDTGFFYQADYCCKKHDFCWDSILSGQCLFDYKNEYFQTVTSCNCDAEFWKCLKGNSDFLSWIIGKGYFNLSLRDCYYIGLRNGCKIRQEKCAKGDNGKSTWRISSKNTNQCLLEGKSITLQKIVLFKDNGTY